EGTVDQSEIFNRRCDSPVDHLSDLCLQDRVEVHRSYVTGIHLAGSKQKPVERDACLGRDLHKHLGSGQASLIVIAYRRVRNAQTAGYDRHGTIAKRSPESIYEVLIHTICPADETCVSLCTPNVTTIPKLLQLG